MFVTPTTVSQNRILTSVYVFESKHTRTIEKNEKYWKNINNRNHKNKNNLMAIGYINFSNKDFFKSISEKIGISQIKLILKLLSQFRNSFSRGS